MINKKGISPLIATVLIIGFTVALAAVIMVWGSDFIKGTTDDVAKTTEMQLACTNADFEIIECNLDTVTIENTGAITLKFIIRNENGALSATNLPAVGLNSLQISDPIICPGKDGNCGESITVFPVVTIDGVETTCTQAGKPATCVSKVES